MKRKLSVLGIGMVAMLLAGPSFAAGKSPDQYGDQAGSQVAGGPVIGPPEPVESHTQRESGSSGMRGDQIQMDSSPGMRGGEQFAAENLKNVDDIKGWDVMDANGKNIGKIDSVLMDSKTGRVEYITLTSGGVVGVGGDNYLIPWRALQAGDGPEEKLQVNLSAEELKSAPKGDQLPTQAQSRELHQFYGVSPEWQENN